MANGRMGEGANGRGEDIDIANRIISSYTVGIIRRYTMATTKTIISLEESLLRRVDELASELQISSSRLFVTAVEEFIQRHQNQKLLAAINAAYDEEPELSEDTTLDAWRRKHRRSIKSLMGFAC